MNIEERLREKSICEALSTKDHPMYNEYIFIPDALQICNEALTEKEKEILGLKEERYNLHNNIAKIESKIQEPKWISVKERMPGFNIRVLGLTDSKNIFITFEDATGSFDDYSISTLAAEAGMAHFTHWQPLPDLPKEEILLNQ